MRIYSGFLLLIEVYKASYYRILGFRVMGLWLLGHDDPKL